MAQFQRHFVQELTKPLIVRQCGDLGFSGDNLSDVISVDLYTDGVEYSGGGTCAGACICPDGSTVALTGSVSGKTASVSLTEDCFAIPGQIGIAIRVTSGTIKTTVLKANYNVEQFSTSNPVDPGSRISLDVGDLIDRIDTAVESIPASADQLKAAMAPNFSATTAYPAGAYVWNNGTLYKFTAAHAAGSWTGTDATAVALGNDVADLKSALLTSTGNEHLEITPTKYTNLSGEYAVLNQTNVSMQGLVVACSEGDAFTITTHGGGAGRAYGWLKSDNKIIYTTGTYANFENKVIVAPENAAYLAVNGYNFIPTVYRGELAINKINNNSMALALYEQHEPYVLPDEYYSVTGKILNSDGTGEQSIANYSTTPYIYLPSLDVRMTGTAFPNTQYNTLVLYDGGGEVVGTVHGAFDFVISAEYPTAVYFRASMDTENPNDYYVKFYSPAASVSLGADLRLPDYKYTNENKILNQAGTDVTTLEGCYTTDYIEITDHVRMYGAAWPNKWYSSFVLYDSSKNVLYKAIGNFDVNVGIDFPTAKYYRASIYPGNLDLHVIIGPEKLVDRVFTVGTDQMFGTLREGIETAVKYNGATVIVYPGTYDLTVEFATEITAATGQVGIELANNVNVIFLSGSYVKALFPTSSVWINTYFQPFRGRDFILDGLNIEASNCRYCIHDEMAGTDVKYHNVYKNCIMKYTRTSGGDPDTMVSGQCIGGGLGKYGYIEVIGGKYTSVSEVTLNNVPCISYHNGSTDGCDSKIFIRDVYLDGTDGVLRFGYYGTSTIKSQVLVSGCSMGGAIQHVAETSGSAVDNFEITEWNNIIRN